MALQTPAPTQRIGWFRETGVPTMTQAKTLTLTSTKILLLAAAAAMVIGMGCAMAQSQVPSAPQSGHSSHQRQAAPETMNRWWDRLDAGG